MRIKTSVVTLFVLLVACAPRGIQRDEPLPLAVIEPVALEGLERFREILDEEQYIESGLESPYKELGFESLEEVEIAELGEPIRIYSVKLKDLQKFEPGTDIHELLNRGNQVMYPVEVKDQTRSSIGIREIKGVWKTVSWGGANVILPTARTLNASADSTDLPLSSYFVVRIPALYLWFVAYNLEERLMLTPVFDYPAFEFKAGVTLPADSVINTILPTAKKYDLKWPK